MKRHAFAGPPNSELDQKMDPRVNSEFSKRHTKYVFDEFKGRK